MSKKEIKIDTNYTYAFYRRDNLEKICEKTYLKRLDKNERQYEIKQISQENGTSVLMREMYYEHLVYLLELGDLLDVLDSISTPVAEKRVRRAYRED